MTDDPTIADVVEGSEPTKPVAAILRAAFQDAADKHQPKAIQLFGYGEPDSELWVTFRMVDDLDELTEGLTPVLKEPGSKKNRTVKIALEMLLMAAVGSYAVVDGETHDIGIPIGMELYDYLGLYPDKPKPMNDRQAAKLIFKSNNFRISNAFYAYDAWVKRGGVDAEEAALGE